jgi:hypothetical protein
LAAKLSPEKEMQTMWQLRAFKKAIWAQPSLSVASNSFFGPTDILGEKSRHFYLRINVALQRQ